MESKNVQECSRDIKRAWHSSKLSAWKTVAAACSHFCIRLKSFRGYQSWLVTYIFRILWMLCQSDGVWTCLDMLGHAWPSTYLTYTWFAMAKAVELVPYFAKKNTTLLIFLPGCHRPILRVQCCLIQMRSLRIWSYNRVFLCLILCLNPWILMNHNHQFLLEAGGTEQAVRPVFVFRGAYISLYFLSVVNCMIYIFFAVRAGH